MCAVKCGNMQSCAVMCGHVRSCAVLAVKCGIKGPLIEGVLKIP